jgi:hypothetical protein
LFRQYDVERRQTLAQLSGDGLGVVVDILGFESGKSFGKTRQKRSKETIFVDLMTGLQECAQVCALESVRAVMLQVVADLEHPPHISEILDDRRQKFSDPR